jgi:hypothetical protein
MHALAVAVSIDQDRLEEANQELQTRVVPMVKQSPGLVSGVWLAPSAGKGHSLLLFDTEQNANAAAEMAKNAPRPDFVKFDSIEVREVIAQV